MVLLQKSLLCSTVPRRARFEIDQSIDLALDVRLTNWLKHYSKLRFTRNLRIRLSRNEAEYDKRDVRAHCDSQGDQYATIVTIAMQADPQLVDTEPRPRRHNVTNHR